MTYFRVNEKCNGCLACVQNCPACALDSCERDGLQVLRHNMARCARCGTCWRICPQKAVEFQYMLHNDWDEVVSHRLVRCTLCGEIAYAELLKDSLDPKLRDTMEALCERHRLEHQAAAISGKLQPGGDAS